MSDGQNAIQTIREQMAYFGLPHERWNDLEIEQACTVFQRLVAGSGLTVEEVGRGMQQFASALTQIKKRTL